MFLDDDDTDRCLCHACVRETYLAREIQRTGDRMKCSFCDEIRSALTLEELADRIEKAFDDHYVRTSPNPDSMQQRMLADRESDYEWDRDGQPAGDAIQEAAGIDEEPALEILEILSERHADFDAAKMGEECEFDSEAHYEFKDADASAWRAAWQQFEHSLKTEARFFSRSAGDHLASVFNRIHELSSHRGGSLVVEVGPGQRIHRLSRARVFYADEEIEQAIAHPDAQLGSPPARVAKAGRMNAQGISVFYGATTSAVALAEVRPPVGSRVVVAEFSIIRPVRLLDLTALTSAQDLGSIFDPTFKSRLERVAFLRTLGRRMARAVMPGDEAIDYLPTQAVADFLATMNEPPLDGIVFPSVQAGDVEGLNVVLFHHASAVEPIQLPPGTRLEASTHMETEDGPESHYTVTEVPPAAPVPPSPPTGQLELVDFLFDPLNAAEPIPPRLLQSRTPALRVDPQSVTVHEVRSVAINAPAEHVHRYRSHRHWSPDDPLFA